MQTSKGQKGFTLIEAVVSAAVFAFVISTSLAVYIATTRLDSKSRAERSLHQNARFIMDYLAKEIRNGSIDYSKANDSDTLNLINQQDEELKIEQVGFNLELTRNGNATFLNSDNVIVTSINFYLYPAVDPFVLANDTHVQPHVTVVLRLRSEDTRALESSSIDVQSTFTVRDYPTVD